MHGQSDRDIKGIDFVKFLMAMAVVAIHTRPFEGVNNAAFRQIWDALVNLAVPYFFIASGFLLYSKVNKAAERDAQRFVIKQYTIRIARLYLYWTALFLPLTLWYNVTNDASALKDLLVFIRGVFLVGDNFYSWPLWYLLSMTYSLILIYWLSHKNKTLSSIVLISAGVFLVSILLNWVMDAESSNVWIQRIGELVKVTLKGGRLFSGMLYLMIGALFATRKVQLQKGMVVLLVLVGAVSQLWKLPIVSPFLYVLLPSVLFYVSLRLKMNVLRYNYFFRKSSTVMYFTHMMVFFLYALIFKQFSYFGWDAFGVSVIIPILLTPVVIRYENTCTFLKQIF
jgi:peptidoglycan/LPS O-acetylase OafA/YrhL